MDKADIYNQLVNTPVNGVYGIDVGQNTLSEGRPPPVVQGEDGQMYLANEYLDADGNWQINPDFSTPVYYFHQPLEAGDARGIYAEYSEDLQSADQQGYWKTEEEIKAYWDGEGATDMNIFKQTNPDMDFNTYMSFIKENSALHAQGITPESDPEAFAGITEKYGIQTSTTDNDNVYGWNGSNYTKTFKPEDPEYGRMLWAAGLGAMGGQVLGGYLSGLGGASLPAGVAGPAAPLMSTGVANGLAAGATSAASQALLTGEIDPGSVLASAVIAGVNPGGYVADNYAPWRYTDPFTGETGWALGGAPPSSFYGGLVSGTVNDLVSNGLINQEIDLQASLEKGLIAGGINSALNTYDEYKKNSLEGLADEYQFNNPTASRQEALDWAANQDRLNTTDLGALVGEDGLFPFIPLVDTSGIRSILDPIGNAVDGLLNGFELPDQIQVGDGEKVNIGSDDLIKNIPRVDPVTGETYYVSNVTDMTTSYNSVSGEVRPLNFTSYEDRQTWGLINNPVVNALGDALGALIGSSSSPGNDLQAQLDYFGEEWTNKNFGDPAYFDSNGNLTVAGAVAKNDYVQIKVDTLGAFYFENSGGLNENYSWSPNPRGDSEIWGTMEGIDGLYSTGGLPIWPTQGLGNSTVDAILDDDGNPITPMNFGPEFTAPGYTQDVDLATATLSSNNDAALRNYDLINLFDALTNSDNNQSTNNQSVDTGGNAGSDSTDTSTLGSTESTGADTVTDELAGNQSSTTDNSTTTATTATNSSSISDDVAVGAGEVLAGSESTLPAGGPNGEINFTGKDGLPPLWTELYGYTKISPYKKARLKVLEGMLGGMMGGGVGNFNNFQFGSDRNPYQKIKKSLYEAGITE